MTTEDRIPRELRERMNSVAASIELDDLQRVILYRGVNLALDYLAEETMSLATAMKNAKPRLLDGPQTVRR